MSAVPAEMSDTLSDVLALANPAVFGRASRVKVLAARVGRARVFGGSPGGARG